VKDTRTAHETDPDGKSRERVESSKCINSERMQVIAN